jgi:DNA-binding transcriptional LysR family regulator
LTGLSYLWDNDAMEDLNDLFYYAQVVEHGGFAEAGRSLGIPRSKLSRRISLLEDRLGVRLIQRSTRRFSVTDIGQEYYQKCQAVLAKARAAQEVIERTRSEPSGLLRVSCAVGLLHFEVARLLSRFMTGAPRVQIQLESTNRRVDVIGEAVDLALVVRFPPLDDTDLILKPLGSSAQCLVASASLTASLGRPVAPQCLEKWPTLGRGKPEDDHFWELHGPSGQVVKAHHRPRLVTSDMTMLHFAALEGVGLTQLPRSIVRADIEAGRLIEILPDWNLTSGTIYAAFASRRGMLPSVRALIDFLNSELSSDS